MTWFSVLFVAGSSSDMAGLCVDPLIFPGGCSTPFGGQPTLVPESVLRATYGKRHISIAVTVFGGPARWSGPLLAPCAGAVCSGSADNRGAPSARGVRVAVLPFQVTAYR